MSTKKEQHMVIIGTGIAGCFMAIMLARSGFTVDIYERFSEEEVCNANSKRSYNITLFGYGVEILKQSGLWNQIEPHLLLLKGTGTQITKYSKHIFIPVESKDVLYYAVSRAFLIELLLKEVSKNKNIHVHFESNLLSINRYDKTMVIQNGKTGKIDSKSYSVLLGADGVNSSVRFFIQQGLDSTHSQQYSDWSYKQVVFTTEMLGRLGLDKAIVYSWTRKNALIISVPNRDGSLSALFVFPKGGKGYERLTNKQQIKNMVENTFPTLLPALNVITESLLTNPEGNFVTIYTKPWYYKDSLAIIGDGAHGFYPFLGQGTSAAFGDCLQLLSLLKIHGPDWGKIFPLYQEARKENMDALGEVSKEGFKRYQRDKKADYEAIYVTFERLMYRIFPGVVTPPLYLPVITDPEHTADHVKKNKQQRKTFMFFGVPLLVLGVTGLTALYELGKGEKKKSNP